MKYLTVRHETRYNYSAPVKFGTHRLMLRPRDSHDLRLVDAELTLSPPGETRWLHDVFGNSVAQVEFWQPAAELMIVSTLHLEHYGLTRPVFPIAPEAQVYPFVYSSNDRGDLGRLLDRHYPDPNGMVDAWAKRFVSGRFMSTYNLLSNINAAIKNEFAYNMRYEEGTQTPLETLERKSGTCRDFALLFIEAVRCLGFGARFITGYLYDPALDSAGGAMQGSGGDPRLGRRLPAGRRLGGIRPDQRADLGTKSHSYRGDARPVAGDPDWRHLRWLHRSVSRHDRRCHGACEHDAARQPDRAGAGHGAADASADARHSAGQQQRQRNGRGSAAAAIQRAGDGRAERAARQRSGRLADHGRAALLEISITFMVMPFAMVTSPGR